MPKLWEVLHELKAGKAIKTGCITYFLKGDQVFFFTRNNPQLLHVSTLLDMHADAEVIDMPDALIPKVDFFAAMEALKAGKTVKSLESSDAYILSESGKVAYQPSKDRYDPAFFMEEEIFGQWVIL